ncbi:hypothetical protein BCR43DRAFT_126844 [Syncephalastrum racemosum]|uniref:Uncharacterized protein n=1 Tax=Syncephalastrum racemosum TaxID=13706 RepID=A0A1X2HKW7_SYNRA|nr:hypothetical protein BCR43DRAFT_126844 [Syncephalastrum racemosum]
MSILMLCIHDLLPLQFVLCMRHFIDFYQQVTAKEHSDQSLRETNDSLMAFNNYSAIFVQWSPSKISFPKYHALFKYVHEIKQLGRLSSYSTRHSEYQHKHDAKDPAKRTNFIRDTFTPQIGSHVMYRDLFFYQYCCPANAADTTHLCRSRSYSPPPRTYMLSSSIWKNGAWTSFRQLAKSNPRFKILKRLTRIYLAQSISRQAREPKEYSIARE